MVSHLVHSGANLNVPKLENCSAGFLSKYLMDFNIPYSGMAKMLMDFTKSIQFFGHGKFYFNERNLNCLI